MFRISKLYLHSFKVDLEKFLGATDGFVGENIFMEGGLIQVIP